MIVSYFAIKDRKTEGFANLFPSLTYGSAERSFRDLVNTKEQPHNKYPDDFSLYFIGTFDDVSGEFSQDALPRLVVEATAVFNQ